MIHLHHDGLSRPLEGAKLRVLSLGAGVQSTTLALMSARGDIEMPDCAVFADTGWEPEAVYQHLAWLETVLPFPVIRVKRKGPDLGELMLEVARGDRNECGNTPLIPYFVDSGMIPKQCSKEFKTRVVAAEVRRQLGIGPGKRGPKVPTVEMWLGISQDEISRCKTNEKKYIINRWPLIEARMNRRNCITWMEERQYPKCPRSSCIFCPFHSRPEWAEMHDNAPADWKRVNEFDVAFRSAHPNGAYLVAERVPLANIDFKRRDEYGLDFENECEGHCST